MSYGSFGVGDYLTATFGSTYDTPLTIVAWVKRTAAAWDETGSDWIVHFGDDFTDRFNAVGLQTNNGAADTVSITAAAAASQDVGDLTFTANAYNDIWVPVIGVWNGAADRDLYIESSSNTITDTTSVDEGSALDSFIVGSRLDDSQQFNGLIAEVAVFSAAWTTTEVNQVQTAAETGPAPNTIDSANCIAYWSLSSDQTSHADESGNGGPSLAENGTVAYNADHPTITSAASNYYYASNQ